MSCKQVYTQFSANQAEALQKITKDLTVNERSVLVSDTSNVLATLTSAVEPYVPSDYMKAFEL